MKNILSSLLIVLLLQCALPVFATDYYSVKSGNAADLKTWSSSRTGNATAPVNFNDPSDNFIVQKGSQLTGNNFTCKGSLIIETGGVFQTGKPGNVSNIATVITINEGGLLKLTPNTTLIAGFMLIQGTLENLGGHVRLIPSPISVPIASINRLR